MKLSDNARPGSGNLMAIMVVVFAATLVEAYACAGCVYERMLFSNWFPKMLAVKLGAALLVATWRLDPFRIFYTFVAYAFVYERLYLYAIWFSDSYNAFVNAIANAGLFILAPGFLDAGLLFFLGRLRFYRRKQEQGLCWWHLAVYLVVSWLLWAIIR